MGIENFPITDNITGQAIPASPNVFLLNHAHHDFVTGRKKRLGDSRITFAIVAIVFVVTGGIFWIGTSFASQFQQLEEKGVETKAVIVDRNSVTHRGRRGSTSRSYSVTYRYSTGEISYTAEQQVSPGTYTRLHVGDDVVIRYLPDDPSVSALSGEYRDDRELGNNQIISVMAFVIGSVIIASLLWIDYRNRRLSYQGRLLAGEITDATGRSGTQGRYYVTVRYRFRTPSGSILEQQATHGRPDLRDMLPQPGTPVLVLYVSDRLQRLM
jgi:hypothetical protein